MNYIELKLPKGFGKYCIFSRMGETCKTCVITEIKTLFRCGFRELGQNTVEYRYELY